MINAYGSQRAVFRIRIRPSLRLSTRTNFQGLVFFIVLFIISVRVLVRLVHGSDCYYILLITDFFPRLAEFKLSISLKF